jgi:hypothetical protein
MAGIVARVGGDRDITVKKRRLLRQARRRGVGEDFQRVRERHTPPGHRRQIRLVNPSEAPVERQPRFRTNRRVTKDIRLVQSIATLFGLERIVPQPEIVHLDHVLVDGLRTDCHVVVRQVRELEPDLRHLV